MASPNDIITPGRVRIGINSAAGADPQLLSDLNKLNIAGQNGTEAWFTNYRTGAGGQAGGFNLKLCQARGTPDAPIILDNGDYVFELEGFAYNGTSFMEGSEIKVTVDVASGGAIVSGQALPTRIEFWTNIVNTVPALKVYISAYGTLVTLATAAGGAGLNIPHGVVPTSPGNGDLWTTSAGGLFGRINGVTENYAPKASPTFTGTVTTDALTASGVITLSSATPLIATDTADASDNKILKLSSASAAAANRGAFINLCGNEATGTGKVLISNGNVASSIIDLQTGGSSSVTIDQGGQLKVIGTTASTTITSGCAVFSGGIGVGKNVTLDGTSGQTIRYANTVAPAAVAVTLGLGPTGSTAGTPQEWFRVSANGTDRYIPAW